MHSRSLLAAARSAPVRRRDRGAAVVRTRTRTRLQPVAGDRAPLCATDRLTTGRAARAAEGAAHRRRSSRCRATPAAAMSAALSASAVRCGAHRRRRRRRNDDRLDARRDRACAEARRRHAGDQSRRRADTLTMFNVVLVEPEIPPNTGNVIRLCANTGARLHLVQPLGFDLSDKQLRRAGLDYHEYADLRVYDSFDDLLAREQPPPRADVLLHHPWLAPLCRRRVRSRRLARVRRRIARPATRRCARASPKLTGCACRCAQAIAASICRMPSPSSSTKRGGSTGFAGGA